MGCVLCGKCGAVEDDNKTVTPPPSVLDSIMQLPRGSSASLSLDSFKVKGILGIGGFGLVREVHYRGGKYALKSMCKHDLLQRGHGVHSVFLEVQTLQFVKTLRPALRRFLCNLHLAFQDDRYVYICVDLCSRGDLRANLSRTAGHRFSEPVARFYIAQVFIALHACHQVGVLHRDCKPENLVLCSNGYLKLTDFGVAKALLDMDKCYSTSGTHGYIAPEVYASPHLHGRTADWFAAGVTLHELLTGRRPFEAHRLSAFRNNLHSDTLDTAFLRSKSALSLECRDFTSRCLDRFPQVRMGAANGFAEIQAHPWFLALDWDGIVHQTVAAPLQPKRVFNRELKCEEVQRAIHAHLNAPSISDADNLKFEQFGYQSEICDSPRQSCDLE